jgi:hypothetical protein
MFGHKEAPRMRVFPVAKGRTGAVLTVVSAALAVVVGLFVILAGVASYKTAKVERGWEATLGSWDEILERYPSMDADDAALELERLSARLDHEGRPRPTPEKTAEFKAVRADLSGYRQTLLEQPRRRPVRPPAKVAAFLAAHEEDLAEVRHHLLGRGVPRWEMHLERVTEAPIPNLLGHIDLQKLLITDALAKTSDGDRERALQDLEASWTLMQSLSDAPILISQLITLADARLLVGALRQIENVPDVWRTRLTEHDFRQGFTTALKYEGLYWTKIDDTADFTSLTGFANKLLNSVAKPYVRYCLADISDDYRRRLENLDEVRAICDYDLSARRADLDIPIPRWNLIGGLIVPSLGGAVNRLAILELDLELTRRLIELEEARRARDGAWPRSLPGGDVSSACSRDRWIYEVSPEGEMTLDFGREIARPGVKGPMLPTRFTVSPRS